MRRIRRGILVIILFIMAFTTAMLQGNSTVHATVTEPDIIISQVKITSSNGQFITLYNNSQVAVDMSAVKLLYFNNYDLKLSTSSKIINLSGSLPSHAYYVVSDDALAVCYKMTVQAVTLGLSSSAGMIEVIRTTQSSAGGLVASELMDSFAWKAWKKPSTTSTETGPPTVQAVTPFVLPTTATGILQRLWADGTAKIIGAGSWQTLTPNTNNPCDLQLIAGGNIPETPPAATVTSVAKPVTLGDAPINIGLVAPEITELLPNPQSPQSDDADEFIELYNPNDSSYVLKGYRIEVGTSYSRGYTFTDEILLPNSYTAFLITSTHAQLSNSEGQVRLVDPASTVLSETPAYENAPDGSAWGISGDSWQWLKKPTPNSVNVLDDLTQEIQTTGTSKKSTGKVAGVSTTTPSNPVNNLDDAAPLHPGILAGVGFAAVAYAIYEYRKDMANRIFQVRRYFRNRRAVRARL